MSTSASRELLVFAVLAAAVAALFGTSPLEGGFSWSDASRHAMDGAFFYDGFRALPVDDPFDWASRFYLRHPAISVPFYPPLFGVVEALFYALTGPSHFSAQLSVAAFLLLLAAGAYRLAKRHTGVVAAGSLALLLIASRETAFWGRQVMLEIPACALLVWSADAFCRYFETRRRRCLYLAGVFYLLSLATKLNGVFMLPVFLSTLAWGVHRRRCPRQVALASAGALLLIAAAVACYVHHFGRVNIGAVLGGQTGDELSRWTPGNWLFYLKVLPGQLGPVIFPAACASLVAIPEVWRRGERHVVVFFAAWLAWGYLFFSLVALKEQRHTVFLLFPLLFLLVYAIRLKWNSAVSETLPGFLAAAALVHVLAFDGVPAVNNVARAADFVARHAPQQSRVLINSRWDGNFIFCLWTHRERGDLAVIRSDKLLLEMAVKRSMGVLDHGLPDDEIIDMLDCYGVVTIVHEKDFWVDLDSMARLQALLRGGRFERVATVDLQGPRAGEGGQFEIYRNPHAILDRPIPVSLNLPIIGKPLQGVFH